MLLARLAKGGRFLGPIEAELLTVEGGLGMPELDVAKTGLSDSGDPLANRQVGEQGLQTYGQLHHFFSPTFSR